jgi:hypothetical protein
MTSISVPEKFIKHAEILLRGVRKYISTKVDNVHIVTIIIDSSFYLASGELKSGLNLYSSRDALPLHPTSASY